MTDSVVLECKALRFGYEKALSEPLEWEVRAGEVWAIAGVNGCGKTTLMRTLLGFLKPISGSCRVVRERSYVPQLREEDVKIPARVCDFVAMGLEHHLSGLIPFYRRRFQSEVRALLAHFELEMLSERSIHEISPGERQRALLAQAMIRRPEIIFLDEATSAMDPVHSRASFQMLLKLAKEKGCAIVAISHSLRDQFEDMTHLLAFDRDRFRLGSVEEMRPLLDSIYRSGVA